MAMDRETSVHCKGGWAFFLISFGLFFLIPSTIMLGIYVGTEMGVEEIMSITFFTIAMVLITVGLALLTYWCRSTDLGQVKDPEGGGDGVEAADKTSNDGK